MAVSGRKLTQYKKCHLAIILLTGQVNYQNSFTHVTTSEVSTEKPPRKSNWLVSNMLCFRNQFIFRNASETLVERVQPVL